MAGTQRRQATTNQTLPHAAGACRLSQVHGFRRPRCCWTLPFGTRQHWWAHRMKSIGTAWFNGRTAELDAAAIRREVERFARLLSATGVKSVRVWCSYNPDLPDDSPLQMPQRSVPPEAVTDFFDEAVRNNVWTYGD